MFQPHRPPPPPYYESTQPMLAPAPAPALAQGQAHAAVDQMSARLAQLRQLGQLKAQGILTEQEFEVQKSKILES
jgi:hypothetical protein